jgi:hypothetical protein
MYEYSVFPTPFVEEAVFSPMYDFGTFIENQLTVDVLVYFWIFYSTGLCVCFVA